MQNEPLELKCMEAAMFKSFELEEKVESLVSALEVEKYMRTESAVRRYTSPALLALLANKHLQPDCRKSRFIKGLFCAVAEP